MNVTDQTAKRSLVGALKTMMCVMCLTVLPFTQSAQAQTDSTPESNANDQTQTFTASNGLDRLPDGEPGQVSVIAVGEFPSGPGSVPVVIKNNTDQSVYRLELKAEFFNSSGTLIGVKESSDIRPMNLRPGEIALTEIYADIDPLPSEFTVNYKIKYEDVPGVWGEWVPVEFNVITFKETSIVGEIINSNDSDIHDIWIWAACIDPNGVPHSMWPDWWESGGEIKAGERETFEATLYPGPCDTYIITGSAHKRD